MLALDAPLENAVAHTAPGDRIEVSARAEGAAVVLAVAAPAAAAASRVSPAAS